MTTKDINERELALAILLEIEKGEKSHIALRQVLEKYQYISKQERAFLTRLTEGTVERQIELDYIINQFSKVKTKKMKPVIRNLLRLAVYQMKYMDHVPDSAACNESVKLAVKKGFGSLRGFVNGVLRNISRNLEQVAYPDPEKNRAEYLSVRWSMPLWIVELWLKDFGKEKTEEILAGFYEERPTTIRVNEAQITKEELAAKLAAEGVTAEAHPFLDSALLISGYDYLGALESFEDGDFQVQDAASIQVAESAGIKAGDYIIDVCAAPGGKALHAAQILAACERAGGGTGSCGERIDGECACGDPAGSTRDGGADDSAASERAGKRGHVEARDLTEYKVDLIWENIDRMGFDNIEAVQMDATVYDADSEEKAVVVIADLPCSGLGVLANKTDIRYKMNEETERELVQLQREILQTIHSYVKPGGTLIYSTCTVCKAENTENAAWFAEHFPEFTLEWEKQMFPSQVSDGFYIAKLNRRK